MTITPFNSDFPLAQNPFRSRIGSQIDDIKNYYAVAFKPGYPLQASELNEMQEIFYVQQSLTQAMMSTWLSQEVLNSAGGAPVTGPGWEGCTPLDPTLITHISGVLTCKIGWYLVKSSTINGGLGVWVYNNTSFTIAAAPNATYGLVVKPIVINCTSVTPPPTNTDSTLKDSSAINVINGPCGAARLQLKIMNFSSSAGSGEFLAPVLQITSSIAAYKNNYRIPT